MRSIVFIIIFILGVSSLSAQQQNDLQSQSSLAISYYNAKEYEKALPLLLAVYERTKAETYFRYYLNSLLNLDRIDEAEAQIEAQIRMQNSPRPEFFISWGHVLNAAEKQDEATDKFETALSLIKNTRNDYLVAANSFISWGEYEYAKRTYLKGREAVESEQFNYELARIYLQLRDYENMLEEYLNLLREKEDQLSRVQSALSSALRLDIDDELRDQFRTQILRRIQAEPSVTGYNQLLIWFFLQEKKFAQALRQSVALDRRTGSEGLAIIQLGNMALRDHEYEESKNAFEYLMDKGEDTPYYKQAYLLNIHASYNEYVTEFSRNVEKGKELAQKFEDGLQYLGYSTQVLGLIQEYAHLLAFHLDRTDDAFEILNRGLKIPQLNDVQQGRLKMELGDIYVYADDPWEAALIYSQAIEQNKTNALGDEIKLKKAKLAYFTGNFEWAKTQLDVLKGSTSKLTANDAMELSLLIGNNLNLDTTAAPLTMFSTADLLFFQNKGDLAMVMLDGLMEQYPYNSLVDDILYRKAKIEIDNNNDTVAAQYLTQIIDNFRHDLLGDDAMFLLAELYDYHLDKKEEAKELYRNMLSYHPGSVYIEESRNRYRELRELFPEDNTELNKEDLFMDGSINSDEF